MPDEIQYLIEKLEPIYDKAKEEEKGSRNDYC